MSLFGTIQILHDQKADRALNKIFFLQFCSLIFSAKNGIYITWDRSLSVQSQSCLKHQSAKAVNCSRKGHLVKSINHNFLLKQGELLQRLVILVPVKRTLRSFSLMECYGEGRRLRGKVAATEAGQPRNHVLQARNPRNTNMVRFLTQFFTCIFLLVAKERGVHERKLDCFLCLFLLLLL